MKMDNLQQEVLDLQAMQENIEIDLRIGTSFIAGTTSLVTNAMPPLFP